MRHVGATGIHRIRGRPKGDAAHPACRRKTAAEQYRESERHLCIWHLHAAYQERRCVNLALNESAMAAEFKPTELDLALCKDPATTARNQELLAAARKKAAADAASTSGDQLPDFEGALANRQGQRETAAASLAAGMIAAEGRPISADKAVAKLREIEAKLEG